MPQCSYLMRNYLRISKFEIPVLAEPVPISQASEVMIPTVEV